ncbi:hypothetical protein Droror1_Dr00010835 [Drosera rotundifolia]
MGPGIRFWVGLESPIGVLDHLIINARRFTANAHYGFVQSPVRPLAGIEHVQKFPFWIGLDAQKGCQGYSGSYSGLPVSSSSGVFDTVRSWFMSRPRRGDSGKLWGNSGGLISWYRGGDRGDAALAKRECEVTVVLLGWLGADPRHMRKYAELYTSRGFGVATFAVSVSNVLWFDMGSRMGERVGQFVNQLVSWLSEGKKDGPERCLVFHTFSNTGWLVYGNILGRLQSRPEIIEKIRGCIVDSGAAPELSTQVYANGFATAILKKSSRAVYSSAEFGQLNSDGTIPIVQEKDQSLIETLLVFTLESTFTFLLIFPNINQRILNIMFTLSERQPSSCPQLYLYSTADKIIPFESVESFMGDQRRMGRRVQSVNFESSPHVDHYRKYPVRYSSIVGNFLNECLARTKQI